MSQQNINKCFTLKSFFKILEEILIFEEKLNSKSILRTVFQIINVCDITPLCLGYVKVDYFTYLIENKEKGRKLSFVNKMLHETYL